VRRLEGRWHLAVFWFIDESFVVFDLVKDAKINADGGFEAVKDAVDHLRGVSERVVANCCIRFLAFPFAARRLSKDHFLFSSERSEETFTNVMDGELILISGSLVELHFLICLGFKKWYFFLDWRLRCL
jgi:hypothetical protein